MMISRPQGGGKERTAMAPHTGTLITPIVYNDGICIIASDQGNKQVGYVVSKRLGSAEPALTLTSDEAHELAAALTWILSEVDKKQGRPSFKP